MSFVKPLAQLLREREERTQKNAQIAWTSANVSTGPKVENTMEKQKAKKIARRTNGESATAGSRESDSKKDKKANLKRKISIAQVRNESSRVGEQDDRAIKTHKKVKNRKNRPDTFSGQKRDYDEVVKDETRKDEHNCRKVVDLAKKKKKEGKKFAERGGGGGGGRVREIIVDERDAVVAEEVSLHANVGQNGDDAKTRVSYSHGKALPKKPDSITSAGRGRGRGRGQSAGLLTIWREPKGKRIVDAKAKEESDGKIDHKTGDVKTEPQTNIRVEEELKEEDKRRYLPSSSPYRGKRYERRESRSPRRRHYDKDDDEDRHYSRRRSRTPSSSSSSSSSSSDDDDCRRYSKRDRRRSRSNSCSDRRYKEEWSRSSSPVRSKRELSPVRRAEDRPSSPEKEIQNRRSPLPAKVPVALSPLRDEDRRYLRLSPANEKDKEIERQSPSPAASAVSAPVSAPLVLEQLDHQPSVISEPSHTVVPSLPPILIDSPVECFVVDASPAEFDEGGTSSSGDSVLSLIFDQELSASKSLLDQQRAFEQQAAASSQIDIRVHVGYSRNVREFDRLAKIGEGSHGAVYKARDKLYDGELRALKRVKLQKHSGDVPVPALREIYYLSRLAHPNIVKLYGVAVGESSEKVFSILEHVEFDLAELIACTPEVFTEAFVKCVSHHTCRALQFLHEHALLIHRDIKPSNMLCTSDGVVKLCDFGLAVPIEGGEYAPHGGSRWYRAPETLLGSTFYTPASDIWALGCVVLEMLSKAPVFRSPTPMHHVQQIRFVLGPVPASDLIFLQHLPEWGLYANVFTAPGGDVGSFARLVSSLSPAGRSFARCLLMFSPGARPSALQALNHEWFRHVTPVALTYDEERKSRYVRDKFAARVKKAKSRKAAAAQAMNINI